MSITTFKNAVPEWIVTRPLSNEVTIDFNRFPDHVWYQEEFFHWKILSFIDETIRNLAVEHDVEVTITDTVPYYVNYADNTLHQRIPLRATLQEGNRSGLNTIECPCCFIQVNHLTMQCPHCDARMYCRSCDAYGVDAFGDYALYCDECSCECADCGNVHAPAVDYGGLCYNCHMNGRCGNCNANVEEGQGHHTDNYGAICDACWERFCTECGNFNEHVYNNYCRRCRPITMIEEDDPQSDKAATEIRLPELEGRNGIRLCGIEIEGGNDNGRVSGNIIANELYQAGLSQIDRMGRYHGGNAGFAKVEADGSCDWECVIGPFNPGKIEHVRALNRVIKIIKNTIADGNAKLDSRCGVHIHISADKVGVNQAYNLHAIYTHIEDVLYRLGAANWKQHRAFVNGDNYCKTAVKEDKKSLFARRYAQDRYYGLSFSNYFERMVNDCRCGAARYGVFDECTCNLKKCTFEFRLFNTTANITKIHAYLALTQALVAKALVMPEVKDPGMYPANPFVFKNFEDMTTSEKKQALKRWEDGMNFIMRELPLTDDEKRSIMYCANRCEIKNIDLEGINI